MVQLIKTSLQSTLESTNKCFHFVIVVVFFVFVAIFLFVFRVIFVFAFVVAFIAAFALHTH